MQRVIELAGHLTQTQDTIGNSLTADVIPTAEAFWKDPSVAKARSLEAMDLSCLPLSEDPVSKF